MTTFLDPVGPGTPPAEQEPAFAAVLAPARALLIVAVLNVLVSGTVGAVRLYQVEVFSARRGFELVEAAELAQATFQVLGMGVAIWGAWKMQRLESYGLAMAASVLMMLPWTSACCVLGLPFGVWSVTVLSQTEVREAFRS